MLQTEFLPALARLLEAFGTDTMAHLQRTIKILLATNHTYPPQRVGGSESSIHNLCMTLPNFGFDVGVYCCWSIKGPQGWRYFLRSNFSSGGLINDNDFEYPVFRSRPSGKCVSDVISEFEPDLVIVNAGYPIRLADEFIERDIPTIVYIRDAHFGNLGGQIRNHPIIRYITTSRDLSLKFEKFCGILPVPIPPIVQPELYQTETQRQNVTFVCPVKQKGLDTALKLAACRPDIPFVFLESWRLKAPQLRERNRQIRHHKNIVLQDRTQYMREVYRKAKIMLVPTPKFEAWGRVVSEAQVSGIPVLASNTGGLPESVGPGGLLVNPEASIDDWNRALSRMWDDPKEYERLAELARKHATRPEFQPDVLIRELCTVFHELLNQTASIKPA